MKHGALTKTDRRRRLRYAVEIRRPQGVTPQFMRLLRRHNIAFVFADNGGRWPYAEDLTPDFVYARLHGAEELYASGYTDSALDWWANRVRAWRGGSGPRDAKLVIDPAKPRKRGRDVYVYFDNDVKVKAPFDAMGLASRLNDP